MKHQSKLKKKECDRLYHLKNRDRIRAQQKEYYQRNREKMILYAKNYRLDNLEKVRVSGRIANQKYYKKTSIRQSFTNATLWKELRIKTLNSLGGTVCVRCGFSDIRALQIDHINGGGKKHIESFSSNKTYHKYVREHPKEFQVLCANCNRIKVIEDRELRKKKDYNVES